MKIKNIKMKLFFDVFLGMTLCVFCCALCLPVVFASQVIASDQEYKIYIKKGRSQNYYHMEYVLTANNLIMPEIKSELMLINEGGHFIVYIKKDAFPLMAPSCKDNIELDMPWTESTKLSALNKISKKTALYQSLRAVAVGEKKEQKVIIELNPNIEVKSDDPIEIELTNCNIFFRTARDEYVDYIGGLR